MSIVLGSASLGTIIATGTNATVQMDGLEEAGNLYIGISTVGTTSNIVLTPKVYDRKFLLPPHNLLVALNPASAFTANIPAGTGSYLIPVPMPLKTDGCLIETNYPFSDGDSNVKVKITVFSDAAVLK